MREGGQQSGSHLRYAAIIRRRPPPSCPGSNALEGTILADIPGITDNKRHNFEARNSNFRAMSDWPSAQKPPPYSHEAEHWIIVLSLRFLFSHISYGNRSQRVNKQTAGRKTK